MKTTIVIDLSKLKPEVREKVAQHLEAVVCNFDALTSSDDTSIAFGLMKNKNLPSDQVLRKLAKNRMVSVREEVALCQSAPIDVLEKLSIDPEPLVRMRVAQNPNTPISIILTMVNDSDWRVLLKLSERDDLTPETLRAIASNSSTNSSSLCNILAKPNIPSDIIEKCAESKDESIIIVLAKCNRTPIAKLEGWASHESEEVRTLIASNPSTPITALLTLADDKELSVRLALAGSCSYDDVFKKLANDKEEDVLFALVNNPQITRSALQIIAQRHTLNSASYIAKQKLDSMA